MALNIEGLATEIEQAVDSIKGLTGTADYKKQYYLALSTAIIKHIQANASVDGGVCTDKGAISGGKVS